MHPYLSTAGERAWREALAGRVSVYRPVEVVRGPHGPFHHGPPSPAYNGFGAQRAAGPWLWTAGDQAAVVREGWFPWDAIVEGARYRGASGLVCGGMAALRLRLLVD